MSTVDEKTWKEFQDAKLLWWINRILHTFGWAIVFEQMPDGTVIRVYPAKVIFRGFGEEAETEGFKGIVKTLAEAVEDSKDLD